MFFPEGSLCTAVRSKYFISFRQKRNNFDTVTFGQYRRNFSCK